MSKPFDPRTVAISDYAPAGVFDNVPLDIKFARAVIPGHMIIDKWEYIFERGVEGYSTHFYAWKRVK